MHERSVSVIVVDNQSVSKLLLPSHSQTFGAIDVVPTQQTSYPAFKIKNFEISFKKEKKFHKTRHTVAVFEYTGWYGTVGYYRSPLEFLRFIRKLKISNKHNSNAPVLLASR